MPDHEALSSILKSEPNGVLFVLFIPTRDKNGKLLSDHSIWLKNAVGLLNKLFGGATTMPPAKGTWRNDETNSIVKEDIVLVHSYAKNEHVGDEWMMQELANFLHGMGRETRQGEIGIVVKDVFHRIRKFQTT